MTTTPTPGFPSELTLCQTLSGLDEARIAELQRFADERGLGLWSVMISREGLDESVLLRKLSLQMGLGFTDGSEAPTPEALAAVPPQVAVAYSIMPMKIELDKLIVLVADPFGWERWDEFVQVLGRYASRVLCPSKEIDRLLKTHYGLGAETVDHLVDQEAAQSLGIVAGKGSNDLSAEDAANEPSVVNFVNKVISEAIASDATDVHFEPYESKYRIRNRIDGVLENIPVPASVKQLKQAIVARIKIMANLDITEKRLPQDGRARVTLAGFDYDLRISVLPGIFGEAINLRIQRRHMVKLDLEHLGYEPEDRVIIDRLISRPHGLILVTGPTGSGKTTTLYTCLQKINNDDTKIITVEDPVEYWMEDILQMQIHDEIGFSFARALRSVLRHDPDVLLVGEIRDRETADIAIRAALTGHLVFATLHTNDAASAVTRLVDIGIEPFLVASSVNGIIAQRLLRKNCEHCKQPQDPSTLEPYELALLAREGLSDQPVYQSKGCEKCRFTGYKGRSAIGEILLLNPEVRSMIQQRRSAEEIKKQGLKDGMQTLQHNAIRTLARGDTTIAEVLRVTQGDSEVVLP